MAHNPQRIARMQQRSTAEVLAFYKAGTLSSAAAEFELRKRGIALPVREWIPKPYKAVLSSQ